MSNLSSALRAIFVAAVVLTCCSASSAGGPSGPFLLASDYQGTVHRLQLDGTPIDTLPISGVLEMAVGPDGIVYGSHFASGSIRKFDPQTGAVLASFPVAGPREVTFGPDGLLYVASTGGSGAVVRFNPVTGQNLGSFASGTSLNAPIGMAFGGGGNLYVAFDTRFGGTPPDSVKRFNGTTGAFIDVFASDGVNIPQHIAFVSDGDLLVSNQGGSTVTRYSPTGTFEGAFLTGLNNPQGIYFRPNGNLVVASTSTFREYDGQTGAFIGTFASGFNLAGDMVLVPEPALGAACAVGTIFIAARRRR